MRSELTDEQRAKLLKQRDEIFTRLDGRLFARQRACLFAAAGDREPNTDGERELLEGLVAFTDAVADVAHDLYGIDCLLQEGEDFHAGASPEATE